MHIYFTTKKYLKNTSKNSLAANSFSPPKKSLVYIDVRAKEKASLVSDPSGHTGKFIKDDNFGAVPFRSRADFFATEILHPKHAMVLINDFRCLAPPVVI